MSDSKFVFKFSEPTPVVPPTVPRPVIAPIVPAQNPGVSSTTNPTAGSLAAASNSTSRLMAGMSSTGNIPSGASDQEKVHFQSQSTSKLENKTEQCFCIFTSVLCFYFLLLQLYVQLFFNFTFQNCFQAALIMQVLQLSDEQIAMLPPEQRQSILVLKEQIAKSTQR